MPLSSSSRCVWLTSLLLLLAGQCLRSSAFAPKPAVIGTAPPMSPTTTLLHHHADSTASSPSPNSNKYERQRQDWIDRSVNYYSKVMREERRRTIGQWPEDHDDTSQEEFVLLAKKHYFAIRKVKDGKLAQAESIYRKIIDELLNEEEDDHCDHAQLAVTTLLLALLTKRMGDAKKTRSVFLQFFRIAVLEREQETECACSAKVLQAYALFEMQQGNSLKSVELVQKALDFDKTLAPVLKWKQFREAQRQQQLLQYRSSSSSLRHATESTSP